MDFVIRKVIPDSSTSTFAERLVFPTFKKNIELDMEPGSTRSWIWRPGSIWSWKWSPALFGAWSSRRPGNDNCSTNEIIDGDDDDEDEDENGNDDDDGGDDDGGDDDDAPGSKIS